jgi:hypothetical protein
MLLPFDNPESDPEIDDYEERRQEQDMQIVGALAKAAEEAGLIQKTDDFSWEWHLLFDAEIEATKAELLGSESHTADDAASQSAQQTPSPPAPGSETSDFGTGGIESDFGAGVDCRRIQLGQSPGDPDSPGADGAHGRNLAGTGAGVSSRRHLARSHNTERQSSLDPQRILRLPRPSGRLWCERYRKKLPAEYHGSSTHICGHSSADS